MDKQVKTLALSMHALELAAEAYLENATISATPEGLSAILKLAGEIRTCAHVVVGDVGDVMIKVKS